MSSSVTACPARTKAGQEAERWPGAPPTHNLQGRRIALFSGNYNYLRDGANQALNRLVAWLEDEAGATVRVYSPTTKRPAFEPAGTLVPVRSIPLPGRADYRLALGLPRKIHDDLDAYQPDLVHLSAPDLLGLGAQKYARARDLPVVASLHTRFETYFSYYGLGWARRMVERHLDRFYRRCDIVLAPTPAIMDELAGHMPAGSVQLWSRGVDHDQFNPAWRSQNWRGRLGYAPADLVPLFFGRLVLEKGLAMFAEVIGALRAEGHRLRPLIVGDGPARAWLSDRLPDCSFTGHLSGDDLSVAVASADILINPSRTEAFGNVVLEAMASGLAVVAADTPSAANLIRSADTGLLCADQVKAYAGAVSRLLGCAALRRSMGIAARARSRDFGWPETLAPVAGIYRKMIDVRPGIIRREATVGGMPGRRRRRINSRPSPGSGTGDETADSRGSIEQQTSFGRHRP